jgi:hypothetical protein
MDLIDRPDDVHFDRNQALDQNIDRVFATLNAHPMIRSERRLNSDLSAFICVHLWFQILPSDSAAQILPKP